uniref:Uncharacterized protein n=1 Tax=Caenorhabditis tropicalis TaxID=1561998 RepID=A0A1I7UR26_9PELO
MVVVEEEECWVVEKVSDTAVRPRRMYGTAAFLLPPSSLKIITTTNPVTCSRKRWNWWTTADPSEQYNGSSDGGGASTVVSDPIHDSRSRNRRRDPRFSRRQ